MDSFGIGSVAFIYVYKLQFGSIADLLLSAIQIRFCSKRKLSLVQVGHLLVNFKYLFANLIQI